MTRSAALLVLAACAPKGPPPSIFAGDPPTMAPPEVATVEPAQDEAPAVAPYLPGQRPPYVSEACLVTSRGLVVPESKAVELYQAAELGAWWEDRAMLCREGRAIDRAYCDQVARRQAQDLDAARADARWLRWAVPAAMVAGVILGVGAAELGDQVGAP